MTDNPGSSATNGGPLVSVVLPAYNAETFVAEAIQSVLNQTHRNVELIVVDDGSSDDTRAIVERFDDPRLVVVTPGGRGGVSRARNLGIERARGELLAFCDADDYWAPTKLEQQLATFEDERVVACGCLLAYVSPSGRAFGRTGISLSEANHDDIAAGRLMPFALSSLVARRAPIDGVGRFDEDLTQAEDIDLLSRLAGKGIVVSIPRILGGYRVHPGSASATHLGRQRMARRFIQERRRAERSGRTISWPEFSAGYRATLNQRRADIVGSAYRRAGLFVAQGSVGRALGPAALAFLLGPKYTIERVIRQRPWRRQRTEDLP